MVQTQHRQTHRATPLKNACGRDIHLLSVTSWFLKLHNIPDFLHELRCVSAHPHRCWYSLWLAWFASLAAESGVGLVCISSVPTVTCHRRSRFVSCMVMLTTQAQIQDLQISAVAESGRRSGGKCRDSSGQGGLTKPQTRTSGCLHSLSLVARLYMQ